MTGKFTLDRFEENWAICEDEKGITHFLRKEKLPAGIKEGTIFTILEDETIIVHKKETAQKRQELSGLFDSLIKK